MTSAQRIVSQFAATLLAAAIGLLLGQPLGYAVAHLVDRDPADIKATFIWCAVLTPPVCGAAGFALPAVTMHSPARRAALRTFASVAMLSVAGVAASYDPPKTVGIPIIEYELTMPAAIRAEGIGSIDLTLWNGRDGRGCYIGRIDDDGPRRVMMGSFALPADNPRPRLSIAFHDGERWTSGGAWNVQQIDRTTIESRFGPWNDIAFTEKVRDLPLPDGPFAIRYRLSRFM